MKILPLYCALFLFVTARIVGAESPIIINELMYHPPEDQDELQWIELFNRSTTPVDLSDWSFTKGVEFKFPTGTSLNSGDFVVIARDTNAFLTRYAREFTNARLFGNFSGKLSHGGEAVALADRGGKTVDSVKYSDRGDWPRGADGISASLERISPSAAATNAANWAASKLPTTVRAAGSPGRTNDNFAPLLPPIVSAVTFSEISPPDQPVKISAVVASADAMTQLMLIWRTFATNRAGIEQEIVMQRVGEEASKGHYEAKLPAQSSGVLTRFRLRAVDAQGATRLCPGENEPRSTFSVLHFANTNTAAIPFGFMLQTALPEKAAARYNRTPTPPQPTRGNGAFICAETNRGVVRLFDHVRLQPRSGGWKIHFQHDRPFHEMTTLDVIFESPRSTLAEPLGDEVFRRAGVSAPETGHMRLWLDGALRGYFLTIEQMNKAFLAKRGRNTDGDMFKLLWYGRGVVGQHEKKTNLQTGHTNLLALIDALTEERGPTQWEIIRKNFNVDAVADYFAVCHLIENWDGFHNNHFLYDDLNGTGKWEIYPWDLDKTFGAFDGAPKDYAWFDMPLTYGMEGDVSPAADPKNPTRHRGSFGGVSWWRRGGYFARPLLANAEFRARFLARLRALCESEFTEEKLYPWIAGMEQRLGPEVRLHAVAHHISEQQALEEFRDDIESLRRFVKGRRAFLLKELQSIREVR